MIQLTGNTIYLPLLIGAHSLHIIGDKLLYAYESSNMPLTLYGEAHIGYGHELLFTKSTIDEEKAKMVVESRIEKGRIVYRNYENNYIQFFETAMESMESFFKSKSLDTGSNYAIIRKVTT